MMRPCILLPIIGIALFLQPCKSQGDSSTAETTTPVTTTAPTTTAITTTIPTTTAETTTVPTTTAITTTIPTTTAETTTVPTTTAQTTTAPTTTAITSTIPTTTTAETTTVPATTAQTTTVHPETTTGHTGDTGSTTTQHIETTTSDHPSSTTAHSETNPQTTIPTTLDHGVEATTETVVGDSSTTWSTMGDYSSTVPSGSGEDGIETTTIQDIPTTTTIQSTTTSQPTTTRQVETTTTRSTTTAATTTTASSTVATTTTASPTTTTRITTTIPSDPTTTIPSASITTLQGSLQVEYITVDGGQIYWSTETSKDLQDPTSELFKQIAKVLEAELWQIYRRANIPAKMINVYALSKGDKVTALIFRSSVVYPKSISKSLREDPVDNDPIVANYVADVEGSYEDATAIDQQLEEAIKSMEQQLQVTFGSVKHNVELANNPNPGLDAGELAAIIVSAVVGALLLLLMIFFLIYTILERSKGRTDSKSSVENSKASMEQSTIVPNVAYSTVGSSSPALNANQPPAISYSMSAKGPGTWQTYNLPPPTPMPRVTVQASANRESTDSDENDDTAYF